MSKTYAEPADIAAGFGDVVIVDINAAEDTEWIDVQEVEDGFSNAWQELLDADHDFCVIEGLDPTGLGTTTLTVQPGKAWVDGVLVTCTEVQTVSTLTWPDTPPYWYMVQLQTDGTLLASVFSGIEPYIAFIEYDPLPGNDNRIIDLQAFHPNRTGAASIAHFYLHQGPIIFGATDDTSSNLMDCYFE